MVDGHNVDRLRCEIVCGAANNQLAHDGLAEDLAARGILYAPDFIANAGGLINVATELDPEGYDAGAHEAPRARASRRRWTQIYDEAERSETTPLARRRTRWRAGRLRRCRDGAATEPPIPDNFADLVGGTPLVRLTRVAPDCGAELIGKLESLNPAGWSRTGSAWR